MFGLVRRIAHVPHFMGHSDTTSAKMPHLWQRTRRHWLTTRGAHILLFAHVCVGGRSGVVTEG